MLLSEQRDCIDWYTYYAKLRVERSRVITIIITQHDKYTMLDILGFVRYLNQTWFDLDYQSWHFEIYI